MTTEHQSNTVIHIGDAYVRINAYLGNDVMMEIRGHLQKVADLARGRDR